MGEWETGGPRCIVMKNPAEVYLTVTCKSEFVSDGLDVSLRFASQARKVWPGFFSWLMRGDTEERREINR